MNLGTASPPRDTLIHELAHVWQSQHHSNPTQFMANCVACQGRAAATNTALGLWDASVKANPDYYEQYPYSAYAYVPGGTFDSYAGEQVAQSVEYGEPAVVAHVRGVAAGAIDPDNERSLAGTHIVAVDRRTPGVRY